MLPSSKEILGNKYMYGSIVDDTKTNVNHLI